MNDLNCWENKFKPCCYSDRLVTKLLLLNETSKSKVDVLEIKKAIYYAKKYHGSQKRQSGEPYYSHPLAVAELVAKYCFKTDILVTSILHDTIEDTVLTRDLIEYIFDTNIANKVYDLTRVKIDRKITSAEIVKQLCLEKKDELLIVKLFDRIHNLQTIGVKPIDKIAKGIKETYMQFLTLGVYLESKYLGMFNIEDQIIQLCYPHIFMQQPYYNLDLLGAIDFQFFP